MVKWLTVVAWNNIIQLNPTIQATKKTTKWVLTRKNRDVDNSQELGKILDSQHIFFQLIKIAVLKRQLFTSHITHPSNAISRLLYI